MDLNLINSINTSTSTSTSNSTIIIKMLSQDEKIYYAFPWAGVAVAILAAFLALFVSISERRERKVGSG